MSKIDSIYLIRIPVQNLERATHFYKEGVGLEFLYDAEGCSYFQLGKIQIILDPKLKGQASMISYFLAEEEIKESYQKLIDLGASPVKAPEESNHFKDRDRWQATLLDTEGNTFGLTADIWNGYC